MIPDFRIHERRKGVFQPAVNGVDPLEGIAPDCPVGGFQHLDIVSVREPYFFSFFILDKRKDQIGIV